MYCSSCGVAVVQDLSYCKRCGAKLGGPQADGVKSSALSPASLVLAMVSVFIIGLGAVITLLAGMKGADPFTEAMVKAFAVLSFLLMLVVEGVLIWLLLGRNKTATKASAPLLKAQTAADLGEASDRMLREPMTSVTEHTTRTMGPLDSQRKSK